MDLFDGFGVDVMEVGYLMVETESVVFGGEEMWI